jgi:methionine synthase II (cobalamin-independent)
MRYPKYTTTVISAYSVPDWYEALDRLVAVGHVSMAAMADDAEVNAAIDATNAAIEGLPSDIHTSTHACQGNYAVGKDFDGQIGHRYFDSGRYMADLICKIGTV